MAQGAESVRGQNAKQKNEHFPEIAPVVQLCYPMFYSMFFIYQDCSCQHGQCTVLWQYKLVYGSKRTDQDNEENKNKTHFDPVKVGNIKKVKCLFDWNNANFKCTINSFHLIM